MARKKINKQDNLMTTENELKLTSLDNENYTYTADGKYKIPKPKKHAEFLEVTQLRVPHITNPDILKEYHIFWQSDENPIDIVNMGKQGYEAINHLTSGEGYENAQPVYAGTRNDGSFYHLYPFRIRHSDFKIIQEMKQNAISAHEQEMNLNPRKALNEGKNDLGDVYATEQMNLGQRGFIKK